MMMARAVVYAERRGGKFLEVCGVEMENTRLVGFACKNAKGYWEAFLINLVTGGTSQPGSMMTSRAETEAWLSEQVEQERQCMAQSRARSPR